jgi:hypothetical protein
LLRLLTACLLIAGLGPASHAGPTETAILAAMRLSEQSSYQWISTVTDDARTYEIVGQTSKDGYTRLRSPAVNALRRRLGRSVTDTQIEFIFRGNVACVVETEDGWLTPEEIPPPAASIPEPRLHAGPNGPRKTDTPRSESQPALPGLPPVAIPDASAEAPRRYSNLQAGLSLPHEELGLIVSSHAEMTVADGIVSGTLTDLGARLLLVREGQREITPVRAAGSFKLWVHHGQVAKYLIRLEGLIRVQTAGSSREILVNQTSETVLKDVGTTQVAIPPEARRKLGP